MQVALRKLSKIGSAYSWSILLWGSFVPVMAGQEKVRLSEAGLDTAFWKILLVTGVWNMTAALLTPPLFSIVHRYPIARPAGLRRVAAYILGSIPYLFTSVCVRGILLPPWNPATQQFLPRSFHGLLHNADLFALQTWDYLVILVVAHAYVYYMRAIRNSSAPNCSAPSPAASSKLSRASSSPIFCSTLSMEFPL
jgi:hypothetical protein